MSAVRLRRLQSDFQRLQDYVRRQPRVELLQFDGDPPERYQLNFKVKGLRKKGEAIQTAVGHLVEIALPRDYPRLPPQCRMLTPVFHPNIAPHAICIGDHWSAGQSLTTVVARIGEMIAFQSYNTKSPLNGEAARWTDQNMLRLPLDAASFVVDESPVPAGRSVASTNKAPSAIEAATPSAQVAAPAEKLVVECGGCNAKLKVPLDQVGKLIRCPRCRKVVRVPGE